MTSVFIAASSPAMRAGLRALLADTSVQVVGEVSTLERLDTKEVPFDVLLVADEALLVDVAPDMFEDGSLALVLMADDEQAVGTLLSLPLHGWAILPFDATAGELHAALFATAQGLVTLSVPIAEQLINPDLTVEPDDLIEPLTTRESQVLALLAQGLPNKLIARELRISTHTVKFHISSIFSKLGASSRTDAVSRGARYGLIVL